MKTLVKMNVTKFNFFKKLVFAYCILVSTLLFSQESRFFIVDFKDKEYNIFINGKVESTDNVSCNNISGIYIRFNNAKKDEIEGISFKVESCEEKDSINVPSDNLVDLTWMKKNSTLRYEKNNEKFIELNNFRNLCIIIPSNNCYYMCYVLRVFSSH